MQTFFVSPDRIGDREIIITGPDVNHIKNVLRMKPGEEVRVCVSGKETGDGPLSPFNPTKENEDPSKKETKDRPLSPDVEYRCRISRIETSQVVLEILWAQHTKAELPCRITLFQGLPKGDKMELIIQKAVELGAAAVVPVAMQRCVTRLDAKRAAAKEKRWNAISESAAKQSGRMYVPQVEKVSSFREALGLAAAMDIVLVPYELADDAAATRQALEAITPGKSVGIFIGPEGGLEKEEVAQLMAMGAKSITLGRRILRTETAGMALIAHLMLQLELS